MCQVDHIKIFPQIYFLIVKAESLPSAGLLRIWQHQLGLARLKPELYLGLPLSGSGSSTWAAFPGMFVGNWIRSEVSGTQIRAHMASQVVA